LAFINSSVQVELSRRLEGQKSNDQRDKDIDGLLELLRDPRFAPIPAQPL
jgi:hypothetical protein